MIKKYSVFWTATALEDLELIITFMAQETPSRAENWLKKIQAKAQSLSKNPKRGRLPPELIHIPQLPFKEIVISPWRLIYQIKEQSIQILAFLDSRRNLEDILFDRLMRQTQT